MRITFLGTGPAEAIPRTGHRDAACRDAKVQDCPFPVRLAYDGLRVEVYGDKMTIFHLFERAMIAKLWK